jgi:hypothetical protein
MIGGLVDRHTIVVRRAPLRRNSHNDEVRDFTQATDSPSAGWAVDAGDTSEDNDGRDGIVSSYTLRGPFTADVLDSDRIVLFGVEYLIDGSVRRQPGPSARTSHTIVKLTRTAG